MYLYVIGLFQLSNLVQGKESRMPSSNNENEMNRKIEIDYQVDFLGRPCVLLLEASSGQNEGKLCLLDSIGVFYRIIVSRRHWKFYRKVSKC